MCYQNSYICDYRNNQYQVVTSNGNSTINKKCSSTDKECGKEYYDWAVLFLICNELWVLYRCCESTLYQQGKYYMFLQIKRVILA